MGTIDQVILLQINHATYPFVDWVMVLASHLKFWTPLLVFLGILVALFGGFRGRAMLLCLGLSIGMVDGVFVRELKDWAQRPRPYQVIDGLRTPSLAKARPLQLAVFKPLQIEESRAEILPVTSGRSFPSGHTANNFAAATILFLFYRRWGWLYFPVAFLVGYSRIYLGVHWPSDVLTSMFLGTGIALLIAALAEVLWKYWAPRIVPTLAKNHPSLFSK